MARTNQRILEKAIKKAIENGWDSGHYDAKYLAIDALQSVEYQNWAELIFSHDFAKALWPEKGNAGEDIYVYQLNEPKRTKRFLWEYHLQQMVISDDPIKYLGENL